MGDVCGDDPVVLVVTTGDSIRTTIEAAVTESRFADCERVGSLAELVDRVGPGSGVGCVIVTEFVEDPETLVERCREVDRDVPIVVANDEPSLVADLSAYGDVRFLPAGPETVDLAESFADLFADFERRRELREDATMFRSYLEEIRHTLFVKDEDRRYIRVARVPGTPGPADLLGERDEAFEPDEELVAEQREQDRRIVEEGDRVIDKDYPITATENEQWYRTTKAPWRDEDGNIRGIVGLAYDVTDEKRMERHLTEQESAFERFARSLSHDLRTPLQVARGNVELARETDETEPLDKAETALDRIVEMMEDVETVARENQAVALNGDDGSSGEPLVRTPIRDVAAHVWSALDRSAATLTFDVPSTAHIVADESALRPLFENLFTNAITHAGEAVTVRVGTIATGGFYVEDDGSGIPTDRREDVLRDGYTTSESGSGTGLSIVTGIATRNGWDVEITESDAGGARIEFHNCMLVETPPDGSPTGDRHSIVESDDVGDVAVAGDAQYDDETGRWVVSGAGENVWRKDNEFHFAHTSVDGPVRVQARVVDVEERSQYSKAGVMIRDSLAESATYGYVGVTPQHGTEVLWRTLPETDGVSQRLGEEPLAYPWYRLEHWGDRVTTSISADGEEFHALDQRRVRLDDPVYVGLAVCSHSTRTLCRATFEGVTVERLEAESSPSSNDT